MSYMKIKYIEMIEDLQHFIRKYDPNYDVIYRFTLRYRDWDFEEIAKQIDDDDELYCVVEEIIGTEEDYFYYALKDMVEEEESCSILFNLELNLEMIENAKKCMKHFESLIPEGDRL